MICKGILNKEEDNIVCKYILGIVEIGPLLTSIQVKEKAIEVT